jgi:hypothetical protein
VYITVSLQNANVGVDDGPRVPYGPEASRLYTLPLGQHVFHVVSGDPLCHDVHQPEEIAGGPGRQAVRIRVHCDVTPTRPESSGSTAIAP